MAFRTSFVCKDFFGGRGGGVCSVFRCICKTAKSVHLFHYVCLSARRPSSWNNSDLTEWIFIKFDIRDFFRKFVENIKVSLKFDNNNW